MGEGKVSIVPKEGHESDVMKNPYIAYNCVRLARAGEVAVVTNGSQTDPVAEKIDAGMSARDALALSLLTLDYEKDDYDTPRVAAVIEKGDRRGWLGVVRKDGINVAQAVTEAGNCHYVATYEENDVSPRYGGPAEAESPEEICDFLLGGGVFAERTNPVTAVAVLADQAGFAMAVKDAGQG